jgi:rfaE bifunctional protein kinase chain/domain/rfaE bifunctional protein nucleotidyltransferase chain/domain
VKIDLYRKICALGDLEALGRRYREAGKRVVHCHGCFDLVHPGHLRYLEFSRAQGDVLVVSLTGDDAIEKADGTRPYVPQELRAENLAAIEYVNHVVVCDGPTGEPVIERLRPDLYVKGKEYEGSDHAGFLAEKTLVEQHGGRVVFSSGEVVFSSTALLQTMSDESAMNPAQRLAACCGRWGLGSASVRQLLTTGFRDQRVAVVGDCMIDQYVFCDGGQVAGEAPILSVRPLEEVQYPGGAAVIASHLKALGARPHLLTCVGDDEHSRWLLHAMAELDVEVTALPVRRTLPSKQRFLVDTQKLLKVDRGEAQPLDSAAQRKLLAALTDLRGQLDALVLTDFGYGTLTLSLLDRLMPAMRPHVKVISGDVSGPRRTLLAMRDADLLTPNERELRSVVGDFDGSLPTLAMALMRPLGLANLAVTMGQRGCLLFRPREERREDWFHARLRSDFLPSLAGQVVDPLGAGDALLSCATLALCAGASLPQAGYLGSAAAAIAVGRVGNGPVSCEELRQWLQYRPELQAGVRAATG